MRFIFVILSVVGVLTLLNTYARDLFVKQAFIMPVTNWSISYALCILCAVGALGFAKLAYK